MEPSVSRVWPWLLLSAALEIMLCTAAVTVPPSRLTAITANTLAAFRRRFIDELAGLFVQVLEVAQEMKLLKPGTVCLDGTKIQADASRHSALWQGHIVKLEEHLKREVQELLALAEQADSANIPVIPSPPTRETISLRLARTGSQLK